MNSQIKQTSLDLLKVIDGLAQRKIKRNIVKSFWNRFFVSHAQSIILQTEDAELKQDLNVCYQSLRPIFEMKQISSLITEGEKLGSPKIPRTQEIKKLLELEIDNIL